MIAAPAAADVVAIPFAPPPSVRYRAVRLDDPSRIEWTETLHYAREGAGYRVVAVAGPATIDAPPRARQAIEALLKPSTGVETVMRLDAQGVPGALVDVEASAEPLRRSTAALLAEIETRHDLPVDVMAMMRETLARDGTPERIEQRLRQGIEPFLVPSLPTLAPGGQRAFTTTIATPVGPLPATGMVVREAGDSDLVIYRIAIESAAGAGDPAAAMLRTRAAGLPAKSAAPLLALADRMATSRFVERTEVAIDRKSGIISRSLAIRA